MRLTDFLSFHYICRHTLGKHFGRSVRRDVRYELLTFISSLLFEQFDFEKAATGAGWLQSLKETNQIAITDPVTGKTKVRNYSLTWLWLASNPNLNFSLAHLCFLYPYVRLRWCLSLKPSSTASPASSIGPGSRSILSGSGISSPNHLWSSKTSENPPLISFVRIKLLQLRHVLI